MQARAELRAPVVRGRAATRRRAAGGGAQAGGSDMPGSAGVQVAVTYPVVRECGASGSEQTWAQAMQAMWTAVTCPAAREFRWQ